MSAATVDNPILASLLGYWTAKRGSEKLPARRDIDPLEMGHVLLPNLLLVDLFDRGTRVRFRLVGTNVVKLLGFDPTNKFLGDVVAGDYGALLGALHRLIYAERGPLCSESLFRWNGGRRMEVQHLLLPLTHGGPDPAIALIGMTARTEEAFAPTLRILAESALHSELRRYAPKPASARDWESNSGRSVA
jgi:hypothetical protein